MKAQHKDYEGHRIELKTSKDDMQLMIDGVPHGFGQLPDGRYFLDDYAYDWCEDLLELAQRFIDHKRVADKIRSKAKKPGHRSEQGG